MLEDIDDDDDITRPFKAISLCRTANFYGAKENGIINQKFPCGKECINARKRRKRNLFKSHAAPTHAVRIV